MEKRAPAIATAYLAAMLQGLTLVSFPASSAILRGQHGLSDAQYGLIFLPQVAATIVGAVFGGSLAARIGLQRLLWLALLSNAVSQIGLASIQWLPNTLALPVLLGSTAFMGLGFGLMGSPMNSYPQLFFPKEQSTATVVMHSLNGGGLMLGPLLMAGLVAVFGWVAFPLCLLGISVLLAAAAASIDFGVAAPDAGAEKTKEPAPLGAFEFWLLASIAVIYAFAEGSFSNWAVVYLQDGKHLSVAIASAALSVFWGGLVGGRLLISALVLKIPANWIWRSLPLLMITAFLLLPYATTPARGIAAFAFAGFACSAFYPLTISLATARFPQHLAWVSAMMIAALMIGTGLGSFVLGALHAHLPFEQLYRISIVYPAVALALSFLLPRRSAPSVSGNA